MALDIGQLAVLPSPFYRVAAKALVFDTANRLLVTFNEDGEAEIPGDDMTALKFVTPAELLQLTFDQTDAPIVEYIDKIWSKT